LLLFFKQTHDTNERIDAGFIPRIDAGFIPRIDAGFIPRIDAGFIPRIDAGFIPTPMHTRETCVGDNPMFII
jgi:hypothetical protein